MEKAATGKIAKLTNSKKQVKMVITHPPLDDVGKDLPKAISGSGFSNMRSQWRRWMNSPGQVQGMESAMGDPARVLMVVPMTNKSAMPSDPSHESGDELECPSNFDPDLLSFQKTQNKIQKDKTVPEVKPRSIYPQENRKPYAKVTVQ